MRINLVSFAPKSGWGEDYASSFIRHIGDDVLVTQLDSNRSDAASVIANAPACDWWFVVRDTDRTIDRVIETARNRGEKVAAHRHGGPETRQYLDVEQKTSNPAGVDLLTVNSLGHKNILNAAGVSCVAVGYPLHPATTAPAQRVNRIIVPGRFSPEKMQVPFLSEALLPYRQAVDIKFLSPPPRTADAEKIRVYLTQLGYSAWYLSEKSYAAHLLTTGVCVVAGANDTFNLSLAKAMVSGYFGVAPNMSPYCEYMCAADMYDPFSINDLRNKVDNALAATAPQVSNIFRFTEAAVIRRIRECLNGYGGHPNGQ